MAKPKKTARDKLAVQKEIKIVVMERDWAGIKQGQKMLVATPQIVDRYIRDIPYGETRTLPALRDELAQAYKCDGTCPLSTSIFVRMSAEAALEDMADKRPETETAPFWRIIESKDKIAGKLHLPDTKWLDEKRAQEAGNN